MRKKKKIKLIDICLYFAFCIITVICIYPFFLVLFNAISSESVVANAYVTWPKEISFKAFEFLLRTPQRVIQATLISVVDSVGGPIITAFVCSLAGYALFREDFILRKPLQIYFMLAMFLPAAGLIPTYMIYTELYGLNNNLLAYLLPNAVTPMGVFLYRTYYRSIPKEILESARIDGATEMQIWAKMMMPLSKAFVATEFFLNFASRWKNYTTSLYYMTDASLQNLEFYIQRIFKDIEELKLQAMTMGQDISEFPVETMRFAVVFFALIPVMLIYPSLQKYFEKGAMVGSVKG